MTMTRLKTTQVNPARDKLNRHQNYICPLCNGRMKTSKDKQPVLDHCHKQGHIRAVVCRNCNGIEGKVLNLARRAKHKLTEEEWLSNLLEYWQTHSTPQHRFLHPTFKTEAEKRDRRNRLARERRARLKAKATE